jgi:hypothetical protein
MMEGNGKVAETDLRRVLPSSATISALFMYTSKNALGTLQIEKAVKS